MELALLCHLIRIISKNNKSREEWLVAPSLLYCSIVVVEEQLRKEYEVYYATFQDNLCIDKLFE